MFAAIRPDEWNLPVLVHVVGAMALVGAVLVVAALSLAALRGDGDSAALTRTAFRTVLIGWIPAYLLMRGGGEWARGEEDAFAEGAWIDAGYAIADGGAVLLIVAAILAGLASRRESARAGGMMRAVAAISVVLVVAYLVAAWVMTTKPT